MAVIIEWNIIFFLQAFNLSTSDLSVFLNSSIAETSFVADTVSHKKQIIISTYTKIIYQIIAPDG